MLSDYKYLKIMLKSLSPIIMQMRMTIFNLFHSFQLKIKQPLRPMNVLKRTGCFRILFLAEREGFEPSRGIASPYRFSKPTPSATWVSLHK